MSALTTLFDGFAAKVLPRLAGIAAAYVVGEAGKHGLTLDQEQVVALMLVAYAFIHRLISKYTNPGDATKAVLIEADKAKVAEPAQIRAALERTAQRQRGE